MQNQTGSDRSFEEENIPEIPKFNRHQFSIRSIMIITIMMAVGSAGVGQLWRAANGRIEDVGPFVIITSMAPLGMMIAMNWLLRLFRML